MSLIALDASTTQASLTLLDEKGAVQGRWAAPLKPGLIETLPLLLQSAAAGRIVTDVAVCTGPGSFTGLRTSIALAQGFAAGIGATLWGVPTWDAYQEALPNLDLPLWVVIRARRGRLFLLRDPDKAEAFADDALPIVRGAVAVAGEEETLAASWLTAHGVDVVLTGIRQPDAACVGLAARRRKQAGDKPKAALPLYVDPPEAKLPAAGLRPAPL